MFQPASELVNYHIHIFINPLINFPHQNGLATSNQLISFETRIAQDMKYVEVSAQTIYFRTGMLLIGFKTWLNSSSRTTTSALTRNNVEMMLVLAEYVFVIVYPCMHRPTRAHIYTLYMHTFRYSTGLHTDVQVCTVCIIQAYTYSQAYSLHNIFTGTINCRSLIRLNSLSFWGLFCIISDISE